MGACGTHNRVQKGEGYHVAAVHTRKKTDHFER